LIAIGAGYQSGVAKLPQSTMKTEGKNESEDLGHF
jgi:hypothetical protein